MEDQLILVNLLDEPIGQEGKLSAHENSHLHRAFSVFLYKDGRMLIQQRALHKYHSGGLWANSCCSHPRVGETLQEAVKRRLLEETGITCPVRELGSFIYREHFPDTGLTEYEFDHVFIGEYGGPFVRNPEEAMDMQYVDIEQIARELVDRPQKYSAWFLTAFPMVYQHIRGVRQGL